MENLRWYFRDFAAWMKGGEGKYQSLLEEGTAESDSRDIFGYLFVGHLLLVSAYIFPTYHLACTSCLVGILI